MTHMRLFTDNKSTEVEEKKPSKSFVGTWFEMSKEDIDTFYQTSTQLPLYQNHQNVKLNTINKATH